jgi:hypothetical protein
MVLALIVAALAEPLGADDPILRETIYYGDHKIGKTLFPLTLALSLGERENQAQSRKQSKALIHQDTADGIPSPQGRGMKGEGKPVFELPHALCVPVTCQLKP